MAKLAKSVDKFIVQKTRENALGNDKGLKVSRVFTQEGKDPLADLEYELRTSKITNPDGSVVFEMKGVEVPKSWTQVATDVLAQKYFRKKGVPQFNKKGELMKDKNGKPVLGAEKSIRQTAKRMAGTWRYWGEKYGYFASKEDAQAFADELAYMITLQYAAPNSPQWFNTGLSWAYGINAEAQGHYYVDEVTGETKISEDAYTRPQPHACFIQQIKDDLVNEGGIFDLLIKEARLFKYGSGTGTNFSSIRGKDEPLSGGGKSSGLMSFLKLIDRGAGAIKSGGTTRRAAKMVCLDVDHPEIEDFINWKVVEEQKVAAMVAGSKTCYEQLKQVVTCAHEGGVDPALNPKLKKVVFEASKAYVPLTYIKRVLTLVKDGLKPDEFDFPTFDVDFRSEAYYTVSGQNSNNSVRLTNDFIRAVESNSDWNLISRNDASVFRTLKARDLWDKIAYSAWACADPGLQFDSTINEWHTCPKDGRINASNPCSEYMFLDDTACNLASLNLIKFYQQETGEFQVENFLHAVRLWTIVLEISVLMAQFPGKEIARRSYLYRTLGLGFANLGTLLMQMGLPYDSEEGRAISAAITAILGGEAYATSAELASVLGPFPRYAENRKDMLRVIRNHRHAVYDARPSDYEKLEVIPQGIKEEYCPENMITAARSSWDKALDLGKKYGYRNAQVTVIAPTGTIGLVMDCDTTGVEPDFALVKFKKLVGGGYFKIANQSLRPALRKLAYADEQITEMINYVNGTASLLGAPAINRESLQQKGFGDEQLAAVEAQLHGVFELNFAFNKWSLGEDFCKDGLGLSQEQLNDPQLNVLAAIGFTQEEIAQADEYICGTKTIEGAPQLKAEHYAVFDCANRCGKRGERYIHYLGHIKMMGAVQPFISGAISKTINLPEEATIADFENAYKESWQQMIKANALYRDGSKLSQPLNTGSGQFDALFDFTDMEKDLAVEQLQEELTRVIRKPFRRRLPEERHSITHKFSVGGHEGYITVGLYDEGVPGEIFIKMSKEGSTLSGIMDSLALSISLNLQYGVPLEVIVSKFSHTRFDPAGMTTNKEIPLAKSIIDYIARWLAIKFLDQAKASQYHNPELVEMAYKHGSKLIMRIPKIGEHLVDDIDQDVKDPESAISQQLKAHATQEYAKQVVGVQEVAETAGALAKLQANLALRQNNEDAPMCGGCGSVMIRNGSCYKCLECGATSGCS